MLQKERKMLHESLKGFDSLWAVEEVELLARLRGEENEHRKLQPQTRTAEDSPEAEGLEEKLKMRDECILFKDGSCSLGLLSHRNCGEIRCCDCIQKEGCKEEC